MRATADPARIPEDEGQRRGRPRGARLTATVQLYRNRLPPGSVAAAAVSQRNLGHLTAMQAR